MKDFLFKFYPIILAFLSFLYSVYLYFIIGDEQSGLYVGYGHNNSSCNSN